MLKLPEPSRTHPLGIRSFALADHQHCLETSPLIPLALDAPEEAPDIYGLGEDLILIQSGTGMTQNDQLSRNETEHRCVLSFTSGRVGASGVRTVSELRARLSARDMRQQHFVRIEELFPRG